MSRPYDINNGLHRDRALSITLEKEGSLYFVAVKQIRPATVQIVNVSTTTGNWTAVATGLTGILAWKLNEKNGRTFRYAFSSAPAAYMTSFGPIQRDTEITAVYVQRPTATDLDMELELWSF